MRLNNTILKPIVTEKSINLANAGRYTFKVNTKVNKKVIAGEIERMYNVSVIDVKTMIVPGKRKRILKTRNFTKTSRWKKATVQLKEGQHIEVFPKE